MIKVKPHIFKESEGSNFCAKNTKSRIVSPCGKSKSDAIHINKKIIKNIHPPKDPAKRRKLSSIRLKKTKRRLRQKMAKLSRKKNRVRSD